MNRLLKCSLTFVFVAFVNNCVAQQATEKGKMFITWGWNRAGYTKSNLNLKGYDYNFTVYKITANDRVTKPVSYYNYLRPDRITIPQTNIRIGYFVQKNKAVVLGVDHMKYVMNKNQLAKVKGTITKEGTYKGSLDRTMPLTEDFLTFEHTDGLNYINLGTEQYGNWYISKKGTAQIDWFFGKNIGVMVPKTNVKLLDYERTDRFHIAGLAVQAKAGCMATFWNHLSLRAELAAGWIYMPNIALHKTGIEGKGKQNFAYWQANWQIGYIKSLKRKTKNRRK